MPKLWKICCKTGKHHKKWIENKWLIQYSIWPPEFDIQHYMNVKLNKWFFHQERKIKSVFRPNLVHYSWKVPETIYNQRRIIKYHLVTCYLQIFNVNIPFFFWVQVKRLWTTWSHLLINTNICIKKKKKKAVREL